MKTNFLTQLFLLAIVSFSLCSCTDDSVTDTKQKENALLKISAPVADDGSTVVEPVVPKPR